MIVSMTRLQHDSKYNFWYEFLDLKKSYQISRALTISQKKKEPTGPNHFHL